MAQDTPEGAPSEDQLRAAQEEAVKAGEQHLKSDEDLIRQTFLEGLKKAGIQALATELPIDHTGHGCVNDPILTVEDVDGMDSEDALALAIEAQRTLTNHMTSNRMNRVNVIWGDVREGWLEIHDRLKQAEAEKALADWGSTPAERNGFMPGETYNEETLEKAKNAFAGMGFSDLTASDAVGSLLNAGLLIRERDKRE